MRKLFMIIVALCVISTMHAEIKPVSQGAYKTEHVGGVTDMYVKLNYATDGTYYAFSLKCASKFNPLTFSLVLGHSPEEAHPRYRCKVRDLHHRRTDHRGA